MINKPIPPPIYIETSLKNSRVKNWSYKKQGSCRGERREMGNGITFFAGGRPISVISKFNGFDKLRRSIKVIF
jgi:hypothetical protein